MNFTQWDEKLLSLGKSMEQGVNASPASLPASRKKPRRKLGKTLLVAAVLIAAFSTTVVASATPYGRSLFQKISAGLFQAEQEGNVQTALGSAEDHGITVEVRAAVAGSDKVTLQLGFSGVEEPDTILYIRDLQNIKLYDEDGNCYSYRMDDSVTDTIRHVKSGSEIGEPFTETYEIDTKIDHTQNVRLEIAEICGVSGYWAIEFPLEYKGIYKYEVNQLYSYGDDISIFIKEITIDAYSTTVYYDQLESSYYHIIFCNGDSEDWHNHPDRIKGRGSSPDENGKVDYVMTFAPLLPNTDIELLLGEDSYHYNIFTIPIGEANRIK